MGHPDCECLLPVALISRCRSTLTSYVTDENIRGNFPFPWYALHNMTMGIIIPLRAVPDYLRRVREEELLYVLHKLRELRLWPGSLWAALSETPSKYAKEQPGTHTISFVPRGILTDVRTPSPLKRSTHLSLLPSS